MTNDAPETNTEEKTMTEFHIDNEATDVFAMAMKTKLKQKRQEGKGGWQDKSVCSAEDLSRMLREHVEKGDPVDVANFCMMLWNRGEGITPPPADVKGQDDDR